MNTLATAKRQIPITDKRLAVVAANADEAFRQLHLTVVCLHCGETPRMGNHPSDASWRMDCACSARTLVNPDQRSAV